MSSSAFFYGTLLHPMVLKRVIGNDGSHLSICSAVLLDHTRHRIRNCDYPAVVPYAIGRDLFSHELSREERSVRGCLVYGFRESDLEFLDVFEGHEYTREPVMVHPLGPIEPLNSPSQEIVTTRPSPLPAMEDMRDPVKTEVYIWGTSVSLLVPELWSYELFIRESAWKWVGPVGDNESYAEVDRRREMNGTIVDVRAAGVPECDS